eukprot:2316307-Ditylum_brightwellii.AAC.1
MTGVNGAEYYIEAVTKLKDVPFGENLSLITKQYKHEIFQVYTDLKDDILDFMDNNIGDFNAEPVCAYINKS